MLQNLECSKFGILHPSKFIGEAEVTFELAAITAINQKPGWANVYHLKTSFSYLVEKVDAETRTALGHLLKDFI